MWYKSAQEFKEMNGYYLGGAWFPRVTRILEIKSKPGLEKFWKEVGNYSSAEDIKNKSAAQGSLVHETVQKFAIGEAVEIPDEIKPAVEAFARFNEAKNIVFHPEFIERKVWSARHRYAGTIDALASIDGKFGVLDIKTSTGFYPEYNLQTAAYVSALQEFGIKKTLELPQDIQTRWILRINQHSVCKKCGATLRDKGGRSTVNTKRTSAQPACAESGHSWGPVEGDIELKEFPYFYKDIKAFMAAKILWEWENDYWLRQIGYAK